MTDPLAFGLAVIGLLAIPGPTNTLLMTSGAMIGIRRSVPLLAAEVAGYCISVAIVIAAAGLISSAVPFARAFLSGMVALYLAALAVMMWRRVAAGATRVVLWRHVFTTTLLNPKGLVFALVIIPHSTSNSLRYFAAFLAIVPVVGTMWITVGALPRERLGAIGHTVVPKVCAVVLACFALFVMASSIQQLRS